MKCQFCSNEVSEKLKASIASNFCPFCGKGIMNPQQLLLKNKFSGAIQRAVADSQLMNLGDPATVDALAALLANTMSELNPVMPDAGLPVTEEPRKRIIPRPTLPEKKEEFDPAQIEEPVITTDEDGDQILLGMGDTQISEKAELLKQKHKQMKEQGFIPRQNRPVNRLS